MRDSAPMPALATLLVASCSGLVLPEEVGEGLVTHDRHPPADTPTEPRPVWTEGDRFVYRKGSQLLMSYRVVEASDAGYRLREDDSGMVVTLGPDLSLRRKEFTDDPGALRVWDPEDTELHFPLWVGKRWTSHVVKKAPGQPAQLLHIDYACDRKETITTAAGTFACLRIWRSSQLQIPGRIFLDKVSVLWYAPEIGWFARRLEDGVLTDLQEFQRQDRPVRARQTPPGAARTPRAKAE